MGISKLEHRSHHTNDNLVAVHHTTQSRLLQPALTFPASLSRLHISNYWKWFKDHSPGMSQVFYCNKLGHPKFIQLKHGEYIWHNFQQDVPNITHSDLSWRIILPHHANRQVRGQQLHTACQLNFGTRERAQYSYLWRRWIDTWRPILMSFRSHSLLEITHFSNVYNQPKKWKC